MPVGSGAPLGLRGRLSASGGASQFRGTCHLRSAARPRGSLLSQESAKRFRAPLRERRSAQGTTVGSEGASRLRGSLSAQGAQLDSGRLSPRSPGSAPAAIPRYRPLGVDSAAAGS